MTLVDTTPSLAEDFRDRMAGGRPVDIILESWTRIEALAATDPAIVADALNQAAAIDPASGYVAVTLPGAVGTAVISTTGELAHADPQFIRWFGDPTDDHAFKRLIRLAQKNGQASGLIETADGGVIAACAGVSETAVRWPLSDPSRKQMELPGRRVALLGFAPSRVSSLAQRAADAFGLTPLEARLAEALLEAANIQEAADRTGVGRETAREALKKAMRKAGAKRSPDLVRRLMDLMSGLQPPGGEVEAVLKALFGATPAEAKAAARFAEGLTAKEVADALGVKEATVRGQLKAVFAKTGVNKAKDLVRLSVEANALTALTGASETMLEPLDTEGRLRILNAPNSRRRIAVLDYGPKGGRPIAVFHGLSTGRLLPPDFVRRLQAAGYRPMIVQRPGFGLTDPVETGQLEAGAEDLAAVLDALKLSKVDLIVRDAGTAAGLTFAGRYPDRVGRGLLVNPRPPADVERQHASIIGAVAKTMLRNPEMILPFAEMLRKQVRTDIAIRTLKRSLEVAPGDVATCEDPEHMARLVRDSQGISARTSSGFVAEMAAHANGWAPPKTMGGDWKMVFCQGLTWPVDLRAWRAVLPKVPFSTIPDAGFLVYYSDPQAIVDLLER